MSDQTPKQSERVAKIREHDYPIYQAFHAKHGMPTKLPPSCLVCGQAQPEHDDWAIQHMELPNIIVCVKCARSKRMALLEELAKLTEPYSNSAGSMANKRMAEIRAALAAKGKR